MEENQVKTDLQKVREVLESLDLNILNGQLIEDNKILFILDEQLFRCRMPNQKECTEADDRRNKLYIKLISEGGYLTKKQLKQTLNDKQNIDIDELEIQKLKLQNELKDLYLTIAIHNIDDTEGVNQLKNKVQEVKSKFLNLSIEITNYLVPCIEERIEKEYVEYLTYVCTEKLNKTTNEEVWEKVWTSFNQFQEDSGRVPNKAIEQLVYLLINTRN